MAKDKRPQEDRSLHVPQKDKLKTELSIRNFPFTPKQQELIRLVQNKDNKIFMISGPAGCSKTFIAVYCALQALSQKKIGEIIYIRNAVESTSHPLGYLKGSLEEKIEPYLAPLVDKLDEFLPKNQVQGLLHGENIRGVPIGFLRGLSLNSAYIIADESQNNSLLEIKTIMTRIGKHSKLFLLADEKQSDIKNSGYKTVRTAFSTDEAKKNGIVTFEFGIEDIMREEVIKFIIEVFDTI